MNIWLDQYQLGGSQDRAADIDDAIRSCDSFLVVLTPESVDGQSICDKEWRQAFRYKKRIIPLLLDPLTDLPPELATRQYVDFTDSFRRGLSELRRHLRRMARAEGRLQHVRELRADAERELRHEDRPQARLERTELDLAEYIRQEAELQRVIAAPEKAREELKASIAEEPARPPPVETPPVRTTTVNAPPFSPPFYFQDREPESDLLAGLLHKDGVRLILLAGPRGMGKTTLACRVLTGVARGQLPDGSPFEVEGIVYLNAGGSRLITLPVVLHDLSKLLSGHVAEQLKVLLDSPEAPPAHKMQELLAALGGKKVIVLLDGLEHLLDLTTLEFRDSGLQEALEALLNAPEHAVRVVITTWALPGSLMKVEHGGRRMVLDLNTGLDSPFAENLLKEMDVGGALGLRSAPPHLLAEARRRTRGYPRELEALVSVLWSDRSTTLAELLRDTATLLPDQVLHVLVGESLNRLDPLAELVVKALAVYGQPVLPGAVDYLLLLSQPSLKSEPLLERLVEMHLVRTKAGRYFLEGHTRSYAYERIPDGRPSDRKRRPPAFTKAALLFWGAEYCRLARATVRQRNAEDMQLSLLEVDLRRRAGDHEQAARLLLRVARRYLLPEGEMALLAQECEQLIGVLDDRSLAYEITFYSGLARRRLGDLEEAILRFGDARGLARQLGDGLAEKRAITNLATCYYELGRVGRAARCYDRALTIARTLGNEAVQTEPLVNLGLCYSQTGNLERAAQNYREGLRIATNTSNRKVQAQILANLGSVQGELGQPSEALASLEHGLHLAEQASDAYLTGCCHSNIAQILVDLRRLDAAAQRARLAADAGERLRRPELSRDGHFSLALAHLLASDLSEARTAVQAAQYHAEGSRIRAPAVHALAGVIAMRQGRSQVADEAFNRAYGGTVTLLDHGRNKLPRALDTQGLALAGRALAQDSSSEDLLSAASAYKTARSLCQARGLVDRTLTLLDALAVVDAGNALPPVRAAAVGQTLASS